MNPIALKEKLNNIIANGNEHLDKLIKNFENRTNELNFTIYFMDERINKDDLLKEWYYEIHNLFIKFYFDSLNIIINDFKTEELNTEKSEYIIRLANQFAKMILILLPAKYLLNLDRNRIFDLLYYQKSDNEKREILNEYELNKNIHENANFNKNNIILFNDEKNELILNIPYIYSYLLKRFRFDFENEKTLLSY